MRRAKTPPRDYFKNVIEVGDRFFYGSPTVAGIVTKIKITSIELATGDGNTMKCKSPDKGVCLDKVPGFIYGF